MACLVASRHILEMHLCHGCRRISESCTRAQAGYGPSRVGEGTGVWVGIQQMEYGNMAAAHMPAMGAFTATGTPFSVAAGRMSFTYGFKGPAVSIDTACSSALVGAHAAAQHLGKHGGTALSAGINLMLAEHTTAATQIAGAQGRPYQQGS